MMDGSKPQTKGVAPGTNNLEKETDIKRTKIQMKEPQSKEFPDAWNSPQDLRNELEWEGHQRRGPSNRQEEKREMQLQSAPESEMTILVSRPARHREPQDLTGIGTVSVADYHSNRFMKFQTQTRQVSLALREHSGSQRGPHTQPAQSD